MHIPPADDDLEGVYNLRSVPVNWELSDASQAERDFYHVLGDAAKNIARDIPVNLRIVESTAAAGVHFVDVSLDPHTETTWIARPRRAPSTPWPREESLGGALPTLCHVIEVIVAICVRAGVDPLRIAWIDAFTAAQKPLGPTLVAPLTMNPSYTNAMIFHTQSQSVQPMSFLHSWMRILQRRPAESSSIINHTMLLRPQSPHIERPNPFYVLDQPPRKNLVQVKVLPRDAAADVTRFRLLHLGKVGRWDAQADHSAAPAETETENETIEI